jgi:hypothetical protein
MPTAAADPVHEVLPLPHWEEKRGDSSYNQPLCTMSAQGAWPPHQLRVCKTLITTALLAAVHMKVRTYPFALMNSVWQLRKSTCNVHMEDDVVLRRRMPKQPAPKVSRRHAHIMSRAAGRDKHRASSRTGGTMPPVAAKAHQPTVLSSLAT